MKKKLFFVLCLFLSGNTVGYFSQYQQDEYVFSSFFKNKPEKGVFVDIGAHNGISLSNTYFFEKTLGWTGICIEPIPEVFEELKKNRSCICLHGAISNSKNNEASFFVAACPEEKNKGFFPEMLSKLVDDKMAQRLAARLQRDRGRLIKVPTFMLGDILEEYTFYHIDYLSIDTEGNELSILMTIDFSKFFIDVIDVENNRPEDKRIRTFLESKGYQFVTRIACDEIYRKIK